MAMWRRKLAIPENLRAANKRSIAHATARLPLDKVVYVDEYVRQHPKWHLLTALSFNRAPLPEPPPPPPPPVKKKKRGFWRRLFRIK